MFDWGIVYIVCSFLVIITLGYLQTRRTLESLESQPSDSACYGTAALVLLVVQAVVSVALYAGSGIFPIVALAMAFTLICHHAVIHRNSNFEEESCSCICFQCKDVSNHETWAVASLVAAIVSASHL
jgi:hypothetical protein